MTITFVPATPVVHGVDLVDVAEFSRLLQPALRAQLSRIFTETELEECGDNERTSERLAGRFATKEAVLKALGLGFGDGVSFLDVETANDALGAPSVVTKGIVSERATASGINSWLLSTSHTSSIAMASVIGVRLETLPASSST